MDFNLRLTDALHINVYVSLQRLYSVLGCMFIRLQATVLCTYWKGVYVKHALQ